MTRHNLEKRHLVELLKAKSRARRTALKSSAAIRLPRAEGSNLRPMLELVERSPHDLIIPKHNARKLESAHVEEVARSISEFGCNPPILANELNEVIDGVVRAEASKRLGMDSVPCIIARHLTPTQQRQLRLAINRLQEKGSWDLGELKFVMQELIIEDVSLEITGFTAGEIDHIMLDGEPPSTESEPLEPDPDQEPVSRHGDVFRLDAHRVTCGDARDPMLLRAIMAEDAAQLILTDEPYNVAIKGHVTGGDHR